MAGFRLQLREALITFEGTDWDGAEVRVLLDVPLEALFAFEHLQAESPELALRRFGREIVLAWNLEDADGQPIPVGEAGFMSLPPFMAGAIMEHWMEALTKPSLPLVQPSPVGVTSAARSRPRAG